MTPIPWNPESLQAVVQVAESLAFLMPMGVAECPPVEAWGPVVRIGWNAPGKGVQGYLWLALTTEAGDETARNMCGLPMGEAVAPADAAEAAGEMANVMIGNLLPLLHGSEAEFHLKAPQAITAKEFPAEFATVIDLGGSFLAIAVAEGVDLSS